MNIIGFVKEERRNSEDYVNAKTLINGFVSDCAVHGDYDSNDHAELITFSDGFTSKTEMLRYNYNGVMCYVGIYTASNVDGIVICSFFEKDKKYEPMCIISCSELEFNNFGDDIMKAASILTIGYQDKINGGAR